MIWMEINEKKNINFKEIISGLCVWFAYCNVLLAKLMCGFNRALLCETFRSKDKIKYVPDHSLSNQKEHF